MTDLTPERLRQEARKFRLLAQKYEELAELLASAPVANPSLSTRDAHAWSDDQPIPERMSSRDDAPPIGMSRGEATRKVIVAAAKFGSTPFSPGQLAHSISAEVAEKTVFAVFQRRKDIFELVGTDPANKRVSLFVLKNHAWVFTYGINMDRKHVREAFHRMGYVYEKLVVDAVVASMPEAKLSWRNFSKKWGGGTATFDDADETSELPGLAYLVQLPDGLKAFEEKERPNYGGETRAIIIDGRRVTAHVFNVVPKLRQKPQVEPAKDYVEAVMKAAEREGLPISALLIP